MPQKVNVHGDKPEHLPESIAVRLLKKIAQYCHDQQSIGLVKCKLRSMRTIYSESEIHFKT